jgi:tetratricopeptide (TPR) repeat protein
MHCQDWGTESGCPHEFYVERENEKAYLERILEGLDKRGSALMITGIEGFGKTSFLNWTKWYIEEQKKSYAPLIAIDNDDDINFYKYKLLVEEIINYTPSGKVKNLLSREEVKSLCRLIGKLAEDASLLFGPSPQSIMAKIFGELISALGEPSSEINRYEIKGKLKDALEKAGKTFNDQGKFLAILIDNAQWLRDEDSILKDLVSDIPPGIAFIITFDSQAIENIEKRDDNFKDRFAKYAKFKPNRYLTMELRDLNDEQIQDLAKKYNYTDKDLGNDIMDCLRTIGVPLGVVSALNYLREKDYTLSKVTKEVLDEATVQGNWVGKTVYESLDEKDKDWARKLSILPAKARVIKVIRCLMQDRNIFDSSIKATGIFIRCSGTPPNHEFYDFLFRQLRDCAYTDLVKGDEGVCKELAKRADICIKKCRRDQRRPIHEDKSGSKQEPTPLSTAAQFNEYRLSGLDDEVIDMARPYLSHLSGDCATSLKLNIDRTLRAAKYDPSIALITAERARVAAENLKDHDKKVHAQLLKGYILKDLYRIEDAACSFDDALESAKEIEDLSGRVRWIYALSRAFQGIQELEKADYALDEGFKSAQMIEDPSLRADAMYWLGRAFRGIKILEKASRAFDESFKSAQMILDYSSKADAMNRLGMAFQWSQRFDDANRAFNESFASTQEISDPSLRADAMHGLGIAFQGIQEFESANHAFNESVISVQAISDPSLKANKMIRLGMAFGESRMFEKASDCLSQAFEAAKNAGDIALMNQIKWDSVSITWLARADKEITPEIAQNIDIRGLAIKRFSDTLKIELGEMPELVRMPQEFDEVISKNYANFAKTQVHLDVVKDIGTELATLSGVEQYESLSTLLEDHFGGSQRASVLAAASHLSPEQSRFNPEKYICQTLAKEGLQTVLRFGYDLPDQGPTNVFSYQSDEVNPAELRGANYPNYAMNVGHRGEYAGIFSAAHAGRMDAFACNPLIKATFANPAISSHYQPPGLAELLKYRMAATGFIRGGLR